MGSHIESPVRAALRDSIFNCLTTSGEALTVGEITTALGDEDAREVARLCYELRTKSGLIEFGEPRFSKPHGKDMKTYQVASVDSAAAWASRTAASLVEDAKPKKAKKATAQPASAGHPWKQAVVAPKAPQKARVTRPLPSHLQSVAPSVAPAESPLEPIDAELIAALQEAITDLPQAIATTEEEMMTEPTATCGQDTDPGAAPEGSTWSRAPEPRRFVLTPEPEAPYIAAPDTFVLTPESAEDEAPAVHTCQGHCANHAKEQEANAALLAALNRDDEYNKIEEIRINLVDAMLIYKNEQFQDDLTWKALTRAYYTAAGASLEVCHG